MNLCDLIENNDSKKEYFEKSRNIILKKKDKLYEDKHILLNQLMVVEENIKNTKQELTQNCIQFFEKHDYIMEQESGMYGETFYICSRCNSTR
jgi:hypothetical protein